jgi:hypothetical protein
MFGYVAANPIANMAQFFRKFRFRKLTWVYETALAVNNSLSVQFSYDRDVSAMYANATHAGVQRAYSGQIATRVPAWAPQPVRCPLINETKTSRSDELFTTTGAGDGVTVSLTSEATLQKYFQGSVAGCLAGTHVSTGISIIGYGHWEVELDLYGFSSSIGETLLLLQAKKAAERKDLAGLGLVPPALMRQRAFAEGKDVEEVVDAAPPAPPSSPVQDVKRSGRDLSKELVDAAPAVKDKEVKPARGNDRKAFDASVRERELIIADLRGQHAKLEAKDPERELIAAKLRIARASLADLRAANEQVLIANEPDGFELLDLTPKALDYGGARVHVRPAN